VRAAQKKVIIITYPKVRYNTKLLAQHKEHCYYQLKKYSPWTIADYADISNMETAIDRYSEFYSNTTDEIRACLTFTRDLSIRLSEVRFEHPDPVEPDLAVADEWMKLSSLMPNTIDKYKDLTSSNYDWSKSRKNYSLDELLRLSGWIDKQKTLAAHEELAEDNISFATVDIEKLNKLQRFTYNLIEDFKLKDKQLLMVLLGTAGTGKSYTVAAITQLYLGLLKKACPTAKSAFLIHGMIIP